MKNIFKNYFFTIVLLVSIIVGSILGIILGESAKVLSPLGDVFLNLMFVIIVPLIFLTVTTSIFKMKSPKRLSKILITIIIVFILTSIISAFIGILTTFNIRLVNVEDGPSILNSLDKSEPTEQEDISIIESSVNLITVSDFTELFSKKNIVALLVFSILLGFAIRATKEKADPVKNILLSANEIILKLLHIVMYYAPIGLGAYFAALVGTFGKEIAFGYLKTFIIYTIISVFVYGIVYSIYAFIAGGRKGLKNYWKSIVPATVTALATCSSAASIPVNTVCSKNIGVSNDITETTIPLGTSFHKDGSVIGSVFKIMFLVYLFNANISTPLIIFTALLATLLVAAVPIGGGTISEMLILTMLGFPLYALPILTIIATIIDPPATVLNVVGDSACSMLVSRVVDGKNWLEKRA